MQPDPYLPPIPPREPSSHKGTYGRCLIIAGSRGMTGAACLATESALRAGAGLATLAVPEGILPIVSSHLVCATFRPVPETSDGTLSIAAVNDLLELGEAASAVVLGPGLTRNNETRSVIRRLVNDLKAPLVLDADGLNAFSGRSQELSERKAPLVITPHPGEMSRLTRIPTGEIQAKREKVVEDFTSNSSLVLVLKGHRTLVSDGQQLFVNSTGNPGMATGGSGDVLAGMIAGLLAQGIGPYPAAKIGVYVHGLAGDLAKKENGEISMTAADILGKVPAAFLQYQAIQQAVKS